MYSLCRLHSWLFNYLTALSGHASSMIYRPRATGMDTSKFYDGIFQDRPTSPAALTSSHRHGSRLAWTTGAAIQ
ncbi:hypothetical protein F5Y13DRAFT_45357 [Hypoxylon sp. FL1857]|nr:hypothetical protein F5Y13DRAFT_45357 [Hypoxylon sp. FL1857]